MGNIHNYKIQVIVASGEGARDCDGGGWMGKKRRFHMGL